MVRRMAQALMCPGCGSEEVALLPDRQVVICLDCDWSGSEEQLYVAQVLPLCYGEFLLPERTEE
jgi:hypothetical protein